MPHAFFVLLIVPSAAPTTHLVLAGLIRLCHSLYYNLGYVLCKETAGDKIITYYS